MPNISWKPGYPTEFDVEANRSSGPATWPRNGSQCFTSHHTHSSRVSSNDSSVPARKKSFDSAEVSKEQQSPSSGNARIGVRDRIQHLTWAWFTTTMSTGGLALILGQTPHQFHGLETIGKIVFIFDLVLFVILVSSIITRFILSPRALKASLTDATEAFFFPTFWLTISTIISNSQVYGMSATGPWLVTALHVIFWLYAGCALLVAILLYLVLFSTPSVNAKSKADGAAPGWVLPIFPVMLAGTLSGVIARHQPPNHALPIIAAGVSFQGLGWMMFCAVMALYLLRLFQTGLVPRKQRASMFMMVGPPSFTALALISNAKALPQTHEYFAVTHPGAQDLLLVLSTWAAVFLWSLAFWFFGLALVACLMAVPRVRWTPAWWAYVFPNIGLTVATINIGKELDSEAILWVGSAMTVALVVVWLFVAGAQIRAIARKMVLWPGKDEDREEPQVREMLKG